MRLGPDQQQADAILDREWDNIRVCLRWAVASGDIDAADAIVAATGPFVVCRVMREHGAWARDVIALDREERHSCAMTLGWAAQWEWGIVGATPLAEGGIAVAPSPDHEDTVLCWRVLAVGNGAEERTVQ